MYKLIIVLLLLFCLACNKTQQNNILTCSLQPCTALFASISISFVDKNNNPVTITNVQTIDLRTNKELTHVNSPGVDYVTGYVVVADDNDLSILTNEGDDIQITATNSVTGEVKTAVVKVSGGHCKCHVAKISGPDKVTFN